MFAVKNGSDFNATSIKIVTMRLHRAQRSEHIYKEIS